MDSHDVNKSARSGFANLTFDLSSLLNLTDLLALEQPFDVPHIRWIYICLFSAVFLCCVLGNGTVIYVILRHRKMRNVTNFFLANLALSDLCVGVFCVLPNLSTFLSPYWYLGKVLCRLYYFVQCTSYTASVLILTVISLERYFAIIHPMLNKRITRMCRLRVVVVLIWLGAAIYGMPNLIAYDIYRVEVDNNRSLAFCVITGHWTIDMEMYSVINFVLLYVSPLILISAMYIQISRVLWRSGRNMGVTGTAYFASKPGGSNPALREPCRRGAGAEHPTSVTGDDVIAPRPEADRRLRRECSMDDRSQSRAGWVWRHVIGRGQWARSVDEAERAPSPTPSRRCVTSGGEESRNRPMTHHRRFGTKAMTTNPLTRRRKVIRLLICIIVSFAICVMPHHIRLLWQNWSTSTSPLTFGHMLVPPTTFFFFYANSALNPFLYALLSHHFRRAFSELTPTWCRRCKDNNSCNGAMARESRVTNIRTSTLDAPAKLSTQSTMNTTVI